MLTPKIVKRERNIRKPWTVRYEATGKQRERSFRFRREAEDFRLSVEYEQRTGTFTDPDERTLTSDYFASWIETHPVRPGTKTLYKAMFRLYVQDAFGSKPIGRVTHDDVRTLLLVTMPASVGESSVRNCRTMLTAMFSQALRSGKVTSSPAAGVRLPSGSTEKADFYMPTQEELTKLSELLGASWGVSVWLMRSCGLRLGEALGVKFEDVRGDMLRVSRQRLADGSVGPLKGRRHGEYRDVPLPRFLALLIDADAREGDVFPPGRTDVFRNRFTKAARALGIDVHPHALRHSYASALLGAGVPIFEVSRYLGHRDIQLTASVYAHLIPSAASRARDVLDGEHG